MKKTISRLFTFIFTFKNITLLAACAFSLVFGYFRIKGINNPDHVDAVILFTLSTLLFWLLADRSGQLDLFEKESAYTTESLSSLSSALDELKGHLARPNGIYAVYPTRDVLPPYKEFIENTSDQIIIISIDLADTSARYFDHLIELAKRNRQIRLIAFNPKAASLIGVAKLLGQPEQLLKSQIETHLGRIKHQCIQGLSKEQLGNVQIRIYDWSPAWVGMAIDPQTPKGKLLVGTCQHGPVKGSWPEFELRRPLGDSTLYDFYSDRFVQVWKESIPWDG